MHLAGFETHKIQVRNTNPAMPAVTWLLFAGIAISLFLGVPYELKRANMNAVGESADADRATYSLGLSYLMLLTFAILNPSLVLTQFWRLVSERLIFMFFLLAILLIAVASLFTVTETMTYVFIVVDILKYFAFICLLPLIIKELQPLLRPGYITFFFFLTALALMYLLLQEGTSRFTSGSRQENVRLGFGNISTAAGNHMAAVVAAIAVAIKGLRSLHYWHVALLTLSAIMLTIGIGFTGARAALVFVIGGSALYFIIRSLKNPLLIVICFTLVLSGSFFLLTSYDSIVNALPDAWQARIERRGGADVTTGRLEIWSDYLLYFRENPLELVFGIKEGKFLGQAAHNWFLGMTAVHGGFVMLLFLLYYSGVMVTAWRTVQATESRVWSVICCVLAMGFLHGMVDNSLFTNGSVLSFIWYGCTGWVCYEGIRRGEWQRRRATLPRTVYTDNDTTHNPYQLS